MWNENGTLELLQGMPKVLTSKHLADIQQVIDNEKFINNDKVRDELCGQYAPFCANCDRSVEKPCAVAYVRTKIKEGMEIEMEGIPSEVPEQTDGDGNGDSPKKIRIAIARKR